MCPDRQIISLYFDGELPSPWKEKMAAHLSDCPKCRNVLAGYRKIGDGLGELSRETIAEAQDRVWKKISSPQLVVSGGSASKTAARRLEAVKRIWKRNITLPLPVAAAALIVVVTFFALMGIRVGNQSLQQEPVAAMMGIGLDDFAMVPVPMHDMNDVLHYLSSQDNGDIMVIRLPEHRFSRSGEPALINAADYSRTRRNFSR